jgi:raffinose/stachyose/melibiose transport system substrate-binding protein
MKGKRFSRRDFLRMGALTTASAALAACVVPATPEPAEPAEAEQPAPTPEPAAAEAKVLTFYHEAQEPYDQEDLFEYYIRPFEEKNPDIKINVTFPADTFRTVQMAVQAGDEPDIVWTEIGRGISLWRAGLLLDMTPYDEQYKWSERLFDWAYQGGTFEGHLWSLPTGFEASCLWHNTEAFEKAGVEVPLPGYNDELIQMCQAIADAGIMPFTHAASKPRWINWLTMMWYNHWAGNVIHYKVLVGEEPWTHPLMVESVDRLKEDVWDKGWIAEKQPFAIGYNDAGAMLGSGQAAMWCAGSWTFGLRSEGGELYDAPVVTTPFPALREGLEPVYPIGTATQVAINAKSKYPDEAALFLDFPYTPEMAPILHTYKPDDYRVPVAVDPADYPDDFDPVHIQHLSNMAEAFNEGRFGFSTPVHFPQKVYADLVDHLPRALDGEITSLEFHEILQATYEAEAAEGNIPFIPKPPGA